MCYCSEAAKVVLIQVSSIKLNLQLINPIPVKTSIQLYQSYSNIINFNQKYLFKTLLSNHRYKNLLLPFLRTNRCIITWYLSTTAYWKPSFYSMQDIFARLATSRHSKYISLQFVKIGEEYIYRGLFKKCKWEEIWPGK